jgi:hypothetical protein
MGEAALPALEAGRSALEAAAAAYLRISVDRKRSFLAGMPSPADLDPESRLLATIAVFSWDGPLGTRWRTWQTELGRSLQAGLGEDGSWAEAGLRGRLRATALNQLSLQVYYR